MTHGRQRLVVTLLVAAALITPALLNHDGFPLSTYPMYSQSRGDVVAVATATGVTAGGETVRLSLDEIGDIDDPLIVAALVRDAIADGAAQTDALCRSIVSRLDDGSGLDRIAVVTETHDVVEQTAGRASLVDREIHATCGVDR